MQKPRMPTPIQAWQATDGCLHPWEFPGFLFLSRKGPWYDASMIYGLRGTIRKLDLPHLSVDVGGVQYLVSVPLPVWESAEEASAMTLTVYTFLREDRLELYGFKSGADRALFAALLNISGIGPKIGLELCSIDRSILASAAADEDASMLTDIKGIGRKTAEKLLVDLKSLFEKHPEWAVQKNDARRAHAAYDTDALSALTSLGYDHASALDALKRVPSTMKKTEDRVAAALRSL